MSWKTPVRSIRDKCLDCVVGQVSEVKTCSVVNCPLWYYRMGHRPKSGALLYDKDFFRENDGLGASEMLKTLDLEEAKRGKS